MANKLIGDNRLKKGTAGSIRFIENFGATLRDAIKKDVGDFTVGRIHE